MLDIGHWLLEQGHITLEQLDRVRQQQEQTGVDLDFLLLDAGLSASVVNAARAEVRASKAAIAEMWKQLEIGENLEEARKALPDERGDLARILSDIGVDSRDVYEAKAREMGLPFVDLTLYRPSQSALDKVPEELVRRLKIVPLRAEKNVLYVAGANVQNDQVMDALRRACRCQIQFVLATPEGIENIISRLYGG